MSIIKVAYIVQFINVIGSIGWRVKNLEKKKYGTKVTKCADLAYNYVLHICKTGADIPFLLQQILQPFSLFSFNLLPDEHLIKWSCRHIRCLNTLEASVQAKRLITVKLKGEGLYLTKQVKISYFMYRQNHKQKRERVMLHCWWINCEKLDMENTSHFCCWPLFSFCCKKNEFLPIWSLCLHNSYRPFIGQVPHTTTNTVKWVLW